MKNHEILAVVLLLAVAGWGIFFAASPEAGLSSAPCSTAGEDACDVQITGKQPGLAGVQPGKAGGYAGENKEFSIKVINGYYSPREITVKQGDNVKLVLDPNTFVGCMSQFNIRGIGKSIQVSRQNYVMEFVADTPGTYRMECWMGMGYGKFIVEPSDGSALPAVKEEEFAPTGASSCGGSSGCGCGGG